MINKEDSGYVLPFIFIKYSILMYNLKKIFPAKIQCKNKIPYQNFFLVGFLVGNYIIFNLFRPFQLRSNAVKSAFSHQIKLASYSHSIVAGGLDVISYSTRFTCLTSLTRRTEIFSRTSQGMRAQSEVIPSIDVTARIPIA